VQTAHCSLLLLIEIGSIAIALGGQIDREKGLSAIALLSRQCPNPGYYWSYRSHTLKHSNKASLMNRVSAGTVFFKY